MPIAGDCRICGDHFGLDLPDHLRLDHGSLQALVFCHGKRSYGRIGEAQHDVVASALANVPKSTNASGLPKAILIALRLSSRK